MEQPEMLLVAFAIAGVTYYLAGLMTTLPKEEWVAWGHIMRNDSIIGMIAIGSVSAIQFLISYIQELISKSSDLQIQPDQAISSIMAQLVTLDVALVGIVAVVSAIPLLTGMSIVLGQVTGPAISAVTSSIFLWTIIQTLTHIIPTLFLTLFSIGLVLWPMPFRIGRQAGSTIMALSMVLYVGLPLAAPFAIWLQDQVVTSQEMDSLLQTIEGYQPSIIDPIFGIKIVMRELTIHLTKVIGGIIVAFIVFPVIYFAVLGLFTKAIANVIGGSSKAISLGRLGLRG